MATPDHEKALRLRVEELIDPIIDGYYESILGDTADKVIGAVKEHHEDELREVRRLLLDTSVSKNDRIARAVVAIQKALYEE